MQRFQKKTGVGWPIDFGPRWPYVGVDRHHLMGDGSIWPNTGDIRPVVIDGDGGTATITPIDTATIRAIDTAI